MSERTRGALGLLFAAVMLGLSGDALLRAFPVGLNVGLWVGLLMATLAVVARWRHIPLAGGGRWLMLPAVGFALGFAWRDSLWLAFANFVALLVCLTLVVSRSQSGRIRIAEVGEYLLAGFGILADLLIGFCLLWAKDVRWGEVPRGGWTRQTAAVVRGLAIAVPLVFVFGGLLASADAVFSGLVSNLFRWDVRDVAQHLFWIGFWSSVAGGIARGTLGRESSAGSFPKQPRFLSLGIVETVTVLGILDALFLTFVLVQFRYFFGGAELVEASVNLTHSQYARQGFFELVAVAALALPLLLVADWLLRREKPAHDRVFRGLSGLLVAMLFVVMASALQRMRLYQDEFGLTELRLYTTAFMGWLAVVFLWFIATVLRGRREQFAFGAMVAGLVLVAALNALNPDALIVTTNVERALAGRQFDSDYVASLGADAVPAIVEALPVLPEQDRQALARGLVDRWSGPPTQDPRSWNWGRVSAWRVINTLAETAR